MFDPDDTPSPPLARPITPIRKATVPKDRVLCERCQAEMYRMHAVWRCSACGYKNDCCGW